MAVSKISAIEKMMEAMGRASPISSFVNQSQLGMMQQLKYAQQLMGQQASGSGLQGSGIMGQVQAQSVAAAQQQIEQHAARQKAVSTLASRITQLRDAPAVKITTRVPDLVGTITAWRGWKLIEGKLCALGMTGIWEPKKAVRAVCSAKNPSNTLSSGHDVPTKDCKCGYWSFRTMDLLQQALDPYATSVQVLGSVEIWGKVIECENGFRSEFAYPKELWLLEEGLEHLSWVYGVPVRRIEV